MIVVVGSSDLGLSDEMGVKLASLLSMTDSVGLRCDRMGNLASPVERLASSIATALGLPIHLFSSVTARSGVYHRDYDLVRGSTRVFALFSPLREMDGGTAHVVKAALDEGIPVEAWVLDEDGSLFYLGSDEGNPYRLSGESRPDAVRSYVEAQ